MLRSSRLCALVVSLVVFGSSESRAQEAIPELTPEQQALEAQYQKLTDEFLTALSGDDFQASIAAGQRAIAASEKIAKNRIEASALLETVAGLQIAIKDYAGALATYKQCLENLTANFGADYYATADGLWNVKRTEILIGLSDEQRTELELARELQAQAQSASGSGDVSQTVQLLVKALAIDEQILPSPHPQLFLDVAVLGNARSGAGELFEAQRLFERGLAMANELYPETQYPGRHPSICTAINNLAAIHQSTGNDLTALAEFREVLEIYALLFPEPLGARPEIATAFSNTAYVELKLGHYAAALDHASRAVEVNERLFPAADFPDGSPAFAGSLQAMVEALTALGELEKAQAASERSLHMYEAAVPVESFPSGHPQLAGAMMRHALVLSRRANYDEARQIGQRGVAMYEALYPVDRFPRSHPNLATALNHLANLHADAKDHRAAQECMSRSLAAHELLYPTADYPTGHPKLAEALANMALMNVYAGDDQAAEPLFARAATMNEALYPADLFPRGSRSLASFLTGEASFKARQGKYDEALDELARAQRMEQSLIEDTLSGVSEATMHSFLATRSGWDNLLLSTLQAIDNPTPAQRERAYDIFLDRKTALFDALLKSQNLRRAAMKDEAVASQVDDLRAARQELANLALRPAADDLETRRAAALERVTQLEQQLNRLVTVPRGTHGPRETVIPETVAAFGFDAALVDIIRYRPFDFQKLERGAPRYFAFVLRGQPGAKHELVDLGSADEIDELVAAIRKNVEQTNREIAVAGEDALVKQFAEPARRLYDRTFGRLEKALAGATTVFLSPDGELNRIPFEALVDAQGRYLVESLAIAYVSGGRDMFAGTPELSSGSVIFASPDYRFDGAPLPASAELAAQLRGADDQAYQGEASAETRGLNWSPLPATIEEAAQITAILSPLKQFSPVIELTGGAALEDTLKKLRPPRVLHLATHGYYLPNQMPDAADDADGSRGGLTTAKTLAGLKELENPLLRAGIVLAGANRKPNADEAQPALDDGWVTAEEIGLLDLKGTDLVVLSACETGLGDVRTGEGVSGLRRAFLYAGARSLVTSLYKVPDGDTQRLMVDFYQGLAANKPKLTALRDAELAAIARRRKEHGAAHPFFWASFILVGDPR